MEYKIIQNSNEDDLEKKVNEYLKSGWKLAGGLSLFHWIIFGNLLDKTFYQAIYKD